MLINTQTGNISNIDVSSEGLSLPLKIGRTYCDKVVIGNKRLFLSTPHMGGREQFYINQAFTSNYITTIGENISQFEKKIQSTIGKGNVLATSSGTAAIHLGLILGGVGKDDLVLCQSFTFAASANPILYQGGIPVFIDSEKDTWNMDPAKLEEAIVSCIEGTLFKKTGSSVTKNLPGKKPKMIIPVHLYGMPAKMNEIRRIAHKYDIPVLEDAAEALGAGINGEYCGTMGKYGVFSFNGNKIITTSGGGALVTQSMEDWKTANFLANQAKDEAPHYQHSHIGFNYRLSNISAGIGRGQMEVLDKWVTKRRKNFEYYLKHLGVIPGLGFQFEPEGFYSNRWLTAIYFEKDKIDGIDREMLRNCLEDSNIETRPLWKPLHLQPIFENFPFFGSGVCEALFETGLCLPSGSNLTESDLDSVIAKILRCVD